MGGKEWFPDVWRFFTVVYRRVDAAGCSMNVICGPDPRGFVLGPACESVDCTAILRIGRGSGRRFQDSSSSPLRPSGKRSANSQSRAELYLRCTFYAQRTRCPRSAVLSRKSDILGRFMKATCEPLICRCSRAITTCASIVSTRGNVPLTNLYGAVTASISASNNLQFCGDVLQHSEIPLQGRLAKIANTIIDRATGKKH